VLYQLSNVRLKVHAKLSNFPNKTAMNSALHM
jgi:hypothetical protein